MVNIDIFNNEIAAGEAAAIYIGSGRRADVFQGQGLFMVDRRLDPDVVVCDDPSQVWVVVAE